MTVITDLRRRPRIAWADVCWFVRADLIALWVVTQFCARHLARFLTLPTGRGPIWWVVLWTVIFGRIVLGIIAIEATEHSCVGARVECRTGP